MNKINSSADRGTFNKRIMTKTIEENGQDPSTDPILQSFFSSLESRNSRELSDEWKENNMEYDLRSTQWICDKAKESETYSQNLYAAMCNNEFVKSENTWDILKEEYWSVSWRTAGGIIADMREEGDYIDWYCSGMGDTPNSVSESVVTNEIREDLKKIGWLVIQNDDRVDI